MKNVFVVLLCTIAFSNALAPDVLFHNPDNIIYANPWMGEIKLRAVKGSIQKAYLLHAGKRTVMNMTFQDNKFEYYTADVGRFDSSTTYQFLVYDMNDSLFLPQTGSYRTTQQVLATPEWAYSKTYYSIFPDGFNNAIPANDPPHRTSWGKIPDREYSYGGDLPGITQKLSYLDSLNIDIILLQPIFSSSSNHKYNVRDYAILDPWFGDTTDLRNLIAEIHKMGKRIVLKIIVTHTGSDFPMFLDVIKNGTNSKYYNWYVVHETPVKTSPPNYECWLNDSRFPKLNLKDTSLRAFLIGYIDYWLHFGFDGIYVGEDIKIDADFVRDLKNSLKKKYPQLLILGSADNTGINGFDGTSNKKKNTRNY